MHYHNALAGKSAKNGAEELKPFIKGENENGLSCLQLIQIVLNYALMFVHLLVQRCVYSMFARVSS